MCPWGLQAKADDGRIGPVMKGTGWMTNNKRIAEVVSARCPGGHQHVSLKGGGRAKRAQEYTVALRRAILQALKEELEDAGYINSVTGTGPVPDEDITLFKPDARLGSSSSEEWFWDDVNGGWLDSTKVREARQEELA